MSTRGEMSPRRRRTSPPPASLPDDDDLLREILLRLPPRPSSLPRASLVSKRWRSLVADPQFQRRFRDHHGKPPLLGFFVDEYSPCPLFPLLDQPDRIPGARFSMPLREGNRIRIVDCRHGLVLTFSSRQTTWRPRHLFVWDPVAREQRCLIFPPELDVDKMFIFNGAVLRPPITYLLIYRVLACLYSSENGRWSNINSLQLQTFIASPEPSTLIGNSICWIMPTEDGGLGFIDISGFHAEIWKRKPDSDGLAVWVLDRAIEFNELSSTWKGYHLFLVGFAEESNAILLKIGSTFFMVYLQSMEFKKLSNMTGFHSYYPFECCYAAGTGIGDGHGGDEVNNM
ncbi:hypothetical protein VPH35_062533 [Triticum aestivum]